MRDLAIAYGNNRQAKKWVNKTTKYEDLKERLKVTIRTTESAEEYAKMNKAQRDAAKDHGGFVGGVLAGGRRKVDTVESRSMIALDGDRIDTDFLDNYETNAPYTSFLCTTHSHTPNNPRVRLIFPLTRDITAEEFVAVSRYLAQMLGIDYFDECSYQPNQLMYWPSSPQNGVFVFKEVEKDWLNPDDILNAHPEWTDPTRLPTSSRESKANQITQQKVQDPLTKEGTVGLFNRVFFPVTRALDTFLSDIYEATDNENRYHLIAASSMAGVEIKDDKFVYYTSAEVSPVDNHLFRVEVKSGKKTRLTQAEGWHKVTMSGDMKYFVDNYSSLKVPRVILLVQNDGKKVKELLKAEDPTKDYNFGEITLGTVKSADGKFNNYYRLIKPMNFDASRKYPVIVYVYGGPHSQMVKNTWQAEMRRWEMYMAQHGYVVFVMDNRGTSNQGAEFEKAIHGQCGQAEMADQMEGIKLLKSLPYVDADRIGVHGWSYGGFMTISLLTNHPDVFKVAVAGGPVIDWKWYEVMYGERYMDSPHTNPEGYAKVSLIHKARDLKGKLLICQGAIDNTVVWEHSLSFIRECIKNNIQVDYFPYPCAEHNVMGKDRIHLMQKVTDYFEDYLK